MSTKHDGDDWLDLKDFADATFFVENESPRPKLRGEPSPWDLTFRIEIKNDRETK